MSDDDRCEWGDCRHALVAERDLTHGIHLDACPMCGVRCSDEAHKATQNALHYARWGPPPY